MAVMVAWQMVPGSNEILENVFHLAREGHLAHALPDAEHQSTDVEHGCSGPFHLCPCHTSISFLTGVFAGEDQPQACSEPGVSWCTHDSDADAHLSGIFRPPIA